MSETLKKRFIKHVIRRTIIATIIMILLLIITFVIKSIVFWEIDFSTFQFNTWHIEQRAWFLIGYAIITFYAMFPGIMKEPPKEIVLDEEFLHDLTGGGTEADNDS